MGMTPTRSTDEISPEVLNYLETRGIPIPDCPPRIRTPEPRDVPGALFDGERVDRVLKAFRALKHTSGQWAGQPLSPDPWQVAYILAPFFGWVRWDDDARGSAVRCAPAIRRWRASAPGGSLPRSIGLPSEPWPPNAR